MDRNTATLKKQYILSLWAFFGSGVCGSISCLYVYLTTGSMLFLLEFLMTLSMALIQLLYCYIAKKLYDSRTNQYEHRMGKFESLGSVIGMLILYLTLLFVVVLSIIKLAHPEPISEPTLFSVLLIVWCFGYGCIMLFNCIKQQRINNTKVLQGQFIQLLRGLINWVICAIVAILGEFAPNAPFAPYVEPIACIIIVIMIAYLSFHVIRDSVYDLLDVSPDRELPMKILKTLTDCYELYDGFETYRIRTIRDTVIIELYLSHNRDLPVAEAMRRNAAIHLAMESAISDSVVQIIMQ